MQSVIVPKIKSTKDKVILLLKTVDKYKDNDKDLVTRYWWDEIKELCENLGLNPLLLKYTDFNKFYRDGKITESDIITRARRKAQEENPELRGSKWKERHDEEKLVRDEINDKLPKHGGGYTP